MTSFFRLKFSVALSGKRMGQKFRVPEIVFIDILHIIMICWSSLNVNYCSGGDLGEMGSACLDVSFPNEGEVRK